MRTLTNVNVQKLLVIDESIKGAAFVDKVINWSYALLALCITYQLLYYATATNISAMAYVVFAWFLFTRLFFSAEMLKEYPLSTFIMLGYTCTQFYLPLLFITLELKPLVHNLTLPHEVFFHATLGLMVLMLAHLIYRSLPLQRVKVSESWLNRAGFFKAPSDLQLWIMGVGGLIASLYVFLYSQTGTTVTGPASDKVIQALLPFAYAPYFIPFKSLYGSQKPTAKKTVMLLIAFTVALFVISIIRNSRGAFMIGFTSVGFAYALGMLLGTFKPPVIAAKTVILALFGFWMITGPLADLGTAMVIVRSQRDDLPRSELIKLTLEAYKDKKAIILRRLEDKNFEGDWDERYLDNLFTARFANIKFNDASLVQASKIGSNNPAMKKYSIDYIWGGLPQPVLTVLKPEVDKDLVYSLSFGDYIYSLAGGGTEVYGGFRTGHIAGSGMAAFGWWYLLILALGMIPVFLLFDKLVIRRGVVNNNGTFNKNKVIFSVCGLISLTSIFQFMPSESVVNPIVFLIRGFLQMLLLYFVLYHITRLLDNFIDNLRG